MQRHRERSNGKNWFPSSFHHEKLFCGVDSNFSSFRHALNTLQYTNNLLWVLLRNYFFVIYAYPYTRCDTCKTSLALHGCNFLTTHLLYVRISIVSLERIINHKMIFFGNSSVSNRGWCFVGSQFPDNEVLVCYWRSCKIAISSCPFSTQSSSTSVANEPKSNINIFPSHRPIWLLKYLLFTNWRGQDVT